MTSPAERLAVIDRTVAWFVENPDKACVGEYATTREGASVHDPNSPDAKCFCFLGRLIVESAIEPSALVQYDEEIVADYGDALDDFLAPLGVCPVRITGLFDKPRPYNTDWEPAAIDGRPASDRAEEVQAEFEEVRSILEGVGG